MLNYTYVEKGVTAPLSCDVSSKSQLSSSSADGLQCVMDASAGNGDCSRVFVEAPTCRSGPPALIGGPIPSFQKHQPQQKQPSQSQRPWLMKIAQRAPCVAASPGSAESSMVSGQQVHRWGQFGEGPRPVPQPPQPLPLPDATSFVDMSMENCVQNPSQQRVGPFHQVPPFVGMPPPGCGGLVPPLLAPAMLGTSGNGHNHQWRSTPRHYGYLSRSAPTAIATGPSTNDDAYIYHQIRQQMDEQNRYREHQQQQQHRYHQPHQVYHNFHHNSHHQQCFGGTINPSPPTFFYGEAPRTDERVMLPSDSAVSGGNKGIIPSYVDGRRCDTGDGSTSRETPPFFVEGSMRGPGVGQEDCSDALDRSVETEKSVAGPPGDSRYLNERRNSHGKNSNDGSRENNRTFGGTKHCSLDEGGHRGLPLHPNDAGKRCNQNACQYKSDGLFPLGENGGQGESYASTKINTTEKTNKLPGKVDEQGAAGCEVTAGQKTSQTDQGKPKAREGNLCISCNQELKPPALTMLGDHGHDTEMLHNQRQPYGEPTNLFGHTPTGVSPTCGPPAAEALGTKHHQGCSHKSPTAHRASQWEPVPPKDLQHYRSNIAVGIAYQGGYSCTESCASGERSGPVLLAGGGGHETVRSVAGNYMWKSPTSQHRRQPLEGSPTQMSGLTCGDGGGRATAQTPSSASPWSHARAPGHARHLPLHPPMYEQHGALEDLFDEGGADIPFEPQVYGNIVSFVCAVSPILLATRLVESPTASPKSATPGNEERTPSRGGHPPTFVEPLIPLRCIWESLDMPFACAVRLAQPVPLTPMRFPQETVVYSPFLSGFRLRFLESSATYAELKAMQSRSGDDSCNAFQRRPASGRTSPTCVCTGESGQGDTDHEPPLACTYPAITKSATGKDCATPRGSVETASTVRDGSEEMDDSSGVGWLTWGAAERPDQRSLVLEQVRDLAAQDPRYSVLLTANVTELDYQSWIAVLWRPVFDQNHCAKHNCGSFIVYYAPRPPRHEIAPLSQSSSALECMNKSWMSPVFRADRAALRWDMWAPSRREVSVAEQTTAQTPKSASPGCTAPLSPALSPSVAAGGIAAGGSAVVSNFEKPVDLNGSSADAAAAREASITSGVAHETTHTSPSLSFVDSTTNTASLGSHCGPTLQSADQPFYARIPVVGIIPNRCRADVWFMPCFRDGVPDPGHRRDIGATGVPPCGYYCAPLFLLTAALQLMSWNAVEEYERQLAKKVALHGGGGGDSSGLGTEGSASASVNGGGPPSGNAVAAGVSSFRAAQDEKPSGVKLLIDAAKYYRQYRESAHTDAQAGTPTPKLNLSGQEAGEVNGRCRTISPSVASNISSTPFTEPGAVVGGLPDFYQWAQFDGPLLKFAERYV
ncbi:hypothetical protein, conserved [Trypanosoma brucei brucei TREU927]|uniref:Uncharacterized protein n=1 Tax=Trypanosoma brucei brucei (strain 927/4 GUTat10.1) TaxID=185431 RepID=Q38FP7_TRYB2|nr:hypothetical protein, conserved [Trypanosoma brucei brucei TREU927]EAN76373.1 hypothetical protein, conserved [Trypanosoma brucei brucei TREU927]